MHWVFPKQFSQPFTTSKCLQYHWWSFKENRPLSYILKPNQSWWQYFLKLFRFERLTTNDKACMLEWKSVTKKKGTILSSLQILQLSKIFWSESISRLGKSTVGTLLTLSLWRGKKYDSSGVSTFLYYIYISYLNGCKN